MLTTKRQMKRGKNERELKKGTNSLKKGIERRKEETEGRKKGGKKVFIMKETKRKKMAKRLYI